MNDKQSCDLEFETTQHNFELQSSFPYSHVTSHQQERHNKLEEKARETQNDGDGR